MSGVPSGSTPDHEVAIRLGQRPIHLRVNGGPACNSGGRWKSKIMTTTTDIERVTCKSCKRSRQQRGTT